MTAYAWWLNKNLGPFCLKGVPVSQCSSGCEPAHDSQCSSGCEPAHDSQCSTGCDPAHDSQCSSGCEPAYNSQFTVKEYLIPMLFFSFPSFKNTVLLL